MGWLALIFKLEPEVLALEAIIAAVRAAPSQHQQAVMQAAAAVPPPTSPAGVKG
jgi:hypothetical protein